MSFRNAFHISVYCLIFAASGILGTAEGGAAPSLLTFIFGAIGFFFNDQRRVFGLSDRWANVLALGAFAAATFEFFGESEESKLLAGTHLIVYLLWIVVLWKRELRHFWWICAMCLLHVALAAVLTNAGWFGPALIGFMILMVWVLTLFSFYRAAQQVAATRTVGQQLPESIRSAVNPEDSRTRGGIQGEIGERLILRRLFIGVMFTSVTSLMVGGTIFVVTPRVWMNAPRNFAQERSDQIEFDSKVTGFDNEVRLGQIGEILESSDLALRLQAFDQTTGDPLDVEELALAGGTPEPYLRGGVLVNYQDGNWKPSSQKPTITQIPLHPAQRHQNLVRQEITLESLDSTILFAMRPFAHEGQAYGGEIDGESGTISLDRSSFSLLRGSGGGRINYRIFSAYPASRSSATYDLLPLKAIRVEEARQEFLTPPGSSLRRLDSLAKRLAAKVAGQAGSEKHRLAVARALESHLRDSGEYRYSLQSSITDTQIDPIEDFLFNRKSGHCEYYAAALALMLRSMEIPSRLITGYKGGEYNVDEQVLNVEQRHAHLWVEAAIGDKWITLDPTPFGDRERSVAQAKAGFWKSLTRGFWEFWNERVVRVSLDRQQQEIFQPLFEALQRAFSSTEGMREVASEFWDWLIDMARSPRKWFSFQGGLAAFILLATPVVLIWLAWKLWKRLAAATRGRGDRSRRSTRQVEFYERFARLLARKGLQRQSHQTQREFGREMERELDVLLAESNLGDIGDEITASFYQVRFGDRPLNDVESHHIDKQLSALETALNQKQT